MSVPLFGQMAEELSCLTREQVESVLEIQQSDAAGGAARRRIGQICVDLGYLTEEQVDSIVARIEHMRWLARSVDGRALGGPNGLLH